VTAASVGERDGGKHVLKQVKKMGKQVSRLTTIWVDGGFNGEQTNAVGDGMSVVGLSRWCYDRNTPLGNAKAQKAPLLWNALLDG